MTGNDDGGPRWLAALGASVLAHVILIASAVGWVAIYSHVIAPDQPMSAYHAHAQLSGPWVSLLVGTPLFVLLARWIGLRHRDRAVATALAFAALYLLTDALILFVAASSIPWGMVALNYLAKPTAAFVGGWLATKERLASG